jgi:two-component system NtrC family sensor kinase
MSLRTRLLFGLAVLVVLAVASSGWLVLGVARARMSLSQETLARAPGEQLVVGHGEDRITRGFAPARFTLVAITLFDGALVLLVGSLLIRRVTRPLEALGQAARRVAAGDLDLPPVVAGSGGDELERLAQAFNRMTVSLREQRDHLVAQEKLATVGRLAAGVAHEVGNPLAAVLGYAELLLGDEPRTEPPSERRDMLERIRRETERIRVIISDLLDYSRPKTGERCALELREWVDQAVSLLRPQARFRGVIVDNQVRAELPLADASPRVLQVLLNLLLNAADAMDGEGKVTVTARVLDGGGGVALWVRDEGPGVPEADREHVFDPFFTTKEPGKGTGLGLAVSRSIAQAHGGDLLLARAEGKGATFVLRLPIWSKSSESA